MRYMIVFDNGDTEVGNSVDQLMNDLEAHDYNITGQGDEPFDLVASLTMPAYDDFQMYCADGTLTTRVDEAQLIYVNNVYNTHIHINEFATKREDAGLSCGMGADGEQVFSGWYYWNEADEAYARFCGAAIPALKTLIHLAGN